MVAMSFLLFTGQVEQGEDQYYYAVCDQVPITVPGRTEEEADSCIDKALEMYVSMLTEQGELDDAIKEYNIFEIEPQPKSIRLPRRSEAVAIGRRFETLVFA